MMCNWKLLGDVAVHAPDASRRTPPMTEQVPKVRAVQPRFERRGASPAAEQSRASPARRRAAISRCHPALTSYLEPEAIIHEFADGADVFVVVKLQKSEQVCVDKAAACDDQLVSFSLHRKHM